MATEKKVFEIIKEAGFEPIEDKGIVVKYAPENLSAKIANFFSMEFYVLHFLPRGHASPAYGRDPNTSIPSGSRLLLLFITFDII